MVYIVSIDNKPLMPTSRHGKVRRLFDRVKYQSKEYFVFVRRKTGYFHIRDLDGNKLNKGSISYKKLEFIEPRKTVLVERRIAGS